MTARQSQVCKFYVNTKSASAHPRKICKQSWKYFMMIFLLAYAAWKAACSCSVSHAPPPPHC